MLQITNATVLTPAQTIETTRVTILDGHIDTLTQATTGSATSNAPGTQIDATGLFLAPGFIDLQLNGGFGDDFTARPDTIWQVGSNLPQYGVTAFLPTIITAPLETTAQAQQILKTGKPPAYQGAMPLGLHIEGPFLNPVKKGAHNETYLRPPCVADVSTWSAEDQIRLVTLAPELAGAEQVISTLRERGVVVSAGHSMATINQAERGFAAGIGYGTHLFNAMPQIHHREPGLVGALLANPAITIGLIADGIHVHPLLINMVWALVGSQRLNLVTDAMAALGMPAGSYQLGDYPVSVSGHTATLPNGTLAGSILSCDAALRNLIKFTGCTPNEAIQTLTTTPATLLGLSKQKGQLAPGYDADLVLLTSTFEVALTIVGGQIVYQHPSYFPGNFHEPA